MRHFRLVRAGFHNAQLHREACDCIEIVHIAEWLVSVLGESRRLWVAAEAVFYALIILRWWAEYVAQAACCGVLCTSSSQLLFFQRACWFVIDTNTAEGLWEARV